MTAKKKVIIDNDDFLLYYPLTRDWCSYHEPWCKGFGGEQNMSERITKLVNDRRGSVYILVKKGKHPSTHIIIGNRVPLKFDGMYTMVDDDLTGTHIKKFFSQHKSMSDFLKLKYDLKERIKYDVKFTEEEINNWAKTNEFSKIVKGIIDNKIHYNGLFSDEVDYLGEELSDYEAYSYKLANQVKINVSGIELFIENDQYMSDVLGIDEEDEYYYRMAMDHYYSYDSEEVDSSELDYMNCWFELKTIKKVDKLFTLFDDEKNSQACSDYDDTEINDFLLKHFPSEWEHISWDLLSEAGSGLSRERSKETRAWIDDETAFEFNVGNSQTSMEISFEQLLFLIWQYKLDDLSGLLYDGNTINQVDSNLSEHWHDSYDFGTESYEEIDRIFGIFLDGLLSDEDGVIARKENSDTLNKILEKHNFKSRSYGGSMFEAYVSDKYGKTSNSIKINKIDMVNGTLNLSKTVKQPVKDKPEETLPADGSKAAELLKVRKTFLIGFEEVDDYIDLENIFADPTE